MINIFSPFERIGYNLDTDASYYLQNEKALIYQLKSPSHRYLIWVNKCYLNMQIRR